MKTSHEAVYEEFFFVDSAVKNSLVRGRESQLLQTLRDNLGVEISKSKLSDRKWSYNIRGEESRVIQAQWILKSLSHDAQNLLKSEKLRTIKSIQPEHRTILANKLNNYLQATIGQDFVPVNTYTDDQQKTPQTGASMQDDFFDSAAHSQADQSPGGDVALQAGRGSSGKRKSRGSNDNKQGAKAQANPGSGQKTKGLSFIDKEFSPRSVNQAVYYQSLENSSIIFAVGSAGGGKTHAPSDYALRNGMKIIGIRPKTTTTGVNPGAYKGDVEEKALPYLSSFESIIPNIVTDGSLSKLLNMRRMQGIVPDHIRGENLGDAVVIIDDAQNLSVDESEAIITRLKETGNERTVFVFTGDISAHQNDLHNKDSGLIHLIVHLAHEIENENNEILTDACSFINFTAEDSKARSSLMPSIHKALGNTPSLQMEDGETLEYTSAEQKAESLRQAAFREAADTNRKMAEIFMQKLGGKTYEKHLQAALERWPHLKDELGADPGHDPAAPVSP